VAERLGEQALVSVYEAASRVEPVDVALIGEGLSSEARTRLWSTRMKTLSG